MPARLAASTGKVDGNNVIWHVLLRQLAARKQPLHALAQPSSELRCAFCFQHGFAGPRQNRLAFKHRQLDSGPEVYRACDALQQTISRLYRQAGIKHGSSHSGRRSLAAKVLAATDDVETVQTILGYACLDHSKPYLTVDQATIRRAYEVAL